MLSCLMAALLAAQAPAAAPKPAAPKPSAAKTTTAKPAAAAKPGAPKPAAAKAKPAGVAATPKTEEPAPLASDEEKTIYAVGLAMARSLAQFDLSPAEVEIVKRAIGDAIGNKPAVPLEEWGPKIQGVLQSRAGRLAEKEKAAAKTFQDQAAAEAGAVRLDSGVIYRAMTPGTGESPKASDTVKVHYRGTLTNGNEFDSSYRRNEPAQFPLAGVIPCWTEGVQKMKVGEKARLVCPSDKAYGDQGRPPQIPGGATLVFEIELLDIVK